MSQMRKFNEYYETLHPELKAYFAMLSSIFPRLLIPYIETATMQRLAKIGYSCGMEHASQYIYNFKFYLSKLDHSISTALMVWHATGGDKKQTLAALLHDAHTPIFSHVIDYMHGDLVKQEKSEADLAPVLYRDANLVALLRRDGLKVEDVCDYKKYPLVDCPRPRLCADRLDGIFLNSFMWTRMADINEIKKIYEDTVVIINEYGEPEYSFLDIITGDRVVELNEVINAKTQSDEDYYFMNLLASLVKHLINEQMISEADLTRLTDLQGFALISEAAKKDRLIALKYQEFRSLMRVPLVFHKEPVKDRVIDPLVFNKRYSSY